MASCFPDQSNTGKTRLKVLKGTVICGTSKLISHVLDVQPLDTQAPTEVNRFRSGTHPAL